LFFLAGKRGKEKEIKNAEERSNDGTENERGDPIGPLTFVPFLSFAQNGRREQADMTACWGTVLVRWANRVAWVCVGAGSRVRITDHHPAHAKGARTEANMSIRSRSALFLLLLCKLADSTMKGGEKATYNRKRVNKKNKQMRWWTKYIDVVVAGVG